MINFAYCFVSISPVRFEAKDQAEIITQLLFGEIVRIIEINEPWCKIETESDGYAGYIDLKHIKTLTDKEARRWSEGLIVLAEREIEINSPDGIQRICRGSFIPEGLSEFIIGDFNYQTSTIPSNKYNSAADVALDYLNTPYLWGGKTPFGIDCSGLTQICFRIFGYNLPRDAYQQVDVGMDIEFGEHQRNDLAYFANSKGKITHVGILNDQNEIIHASGHVRKDNFTIDGIVNAYSGVLSHKLTAIKRLN